MQLETAGAVAVVAAAAVAFVETAVVAVSAGHWTDESKIDLKTRSKSLIQKIHNCNLIHYNCLG